MARGRVQHPSLRFSDAWQDEVRPLFSLIGSGTEIDLQRGYRNISSVLSRVCNPQGSASCCALSAYIASGALYGMLWNVDRAVIVGPWWKVKMVGRHSSRARRDADGEKFRASAPTFWHSPVESEL